MVAQPKIQNSKLKTFMSYSHFNTLRMVRQKLHIQTEYRPLWPDVAPVEPSAWLKETLNITLSHNTAYFSEKSRSEAIVFPILAEIQRRHDYRIALYSGAMIEGNKELGLSGECDFVMGTRSQSLELEAPVFCVVEAKDNDLELGLPQCIAQLAGVRLFNKEDDLELPRLYGCVTTGTEWMFLVLKDNTATVDTQRYYVSELPSLLGALEEVVAAFG